jgi:hypothetical protein
MKFSASIVASVLYIFVCAFGLSRTEAASEPIQVVNVHGPAYIAPEVAAAAVLRFARTGRPFNRVNRDKHGRRRICKCKTTDRDHFFKRPNPVDQMIDVVLNGSAAPVIFHETPEGPDLSVKEFAIVVTPALMGRPMKIVLYLRDDTKRQRMQRLSPPPQLLDAMTRSSQLVPTALKAS